jgi:hypothetical protein
MGTLKKFIKIIVAILGIVAAVGYISLLERYLSGSKTPERYLELKIEPVVIPIPDYQSPWLRPGWRDCGTDEKALHEQAEEAKKVRP